MRKRLRDDMAQPRLESKLTGSHHVGYLNHSSLLRARRSRNGLLGHKTSVVAKGRVITSTWTNNAHIGEVHRVPVPKSASGKFQRSAIIGRSIAKNATESRESRQSCRNGLRAAMSTGMHASVRPRIP
jgi:hypothetical protein